MRVQVIHEDRNGAKTDIGMFDLNHMPPVGEPFRVNPNTCFSCKAYFGPDEKGMYLLVLEGEPRMLD
ncbi:MAG TPA: hypothetical protein VM406_14020 [Noviherbaspirillum sp.]|nr:hypothetical protein [Noviherbaspirillum sp.]